MTSAELLVDGFGRIRETVADVLSDDMMHVGQATYAHGIVLRACAS
jgi:hypothetical protein